MELSKEVINRPALGCMARLGDLFDARSETFLNISIFKNLDLPSSCISANDCHTTNIQFLNSESYADRVNGYNLNAGMTLKLLSGQLGQVAGSGKYLQKENSKTKATKSTLMYSVTTKVEKLEIYDQKLQDCISKESLKSAADDETGASATHVVVRIDWGAKIVVTAEESSKGATGTQESKLALDGELCKMFSQVDIKANASCEKDMAIDNKLRNYSVQLYGDILPKSGSGGQNSSWEQIQELMKNFSTLLQDSNEGKGKPLSYGLIPISLLQSHFKVAASPRKWRQIDDEIVSSFVTIFDRVQTLKQELEEFMQKIKDYDYCLSKEDLRKADELQDNFNESDLKLKSELKRALQDVQKGEIDTEVFNDLRSKYSIQKCEVFKSTEAFVKDRGDEIGQKISRAKMLLSHNIRYLKRGESVETATLGSGGGVQKVYVLYMGKAVPVVQPSIQFKDNLKLFIQIAQTAMKNKNQNSDEFIFVDCRIHEDEFSSDPAHSAIQFYKQGNLESEDMLKDNREISITGTYNLENNGNYGEFLTALGFWGPQWYAIMGSNSTVTISKNDERYKIVIATTVGTVSTDFILDKEFGEKTADGFYAQSTVTREGNSLIHKQLLSNSGKKTEERIIERVFSRSEMVVNMTAKGVKATRVYKRVLQ